MSEDGLDGKKEDANGQCMFQFWVDRVESFYCELEGCKWDLSESYSQFNSLQKPIKLTSQTPMRQITTARRSIAPVYPAGSFVVRTGVSVSQSRSLHLDTS
jgi:hypothetical protein